MKKPEYDIFTVDLAYSCASINKFLIKQKKHESNFAGGLVVKSLDSTVTFSLRFEYHICKQVANVLYAQVNSASYPQRSGK